jgi:hypothetical protein
LAGFLPPALAPSPRPSLSPPPTADGNPEIWDAFMDSIEPLSARLPYMVQVGNHEYGARALWRPSADTALGDA